MIETLTDVLQSTGINLDNLEAEWRRRLDTRLLETEEMDRLAERVERLERELGELRQGLEALRRELGA